MYNGENDNNNIYTDKDNNSVLSKDLNYTDQNLSLDRLFYGFKVILLGDIQVGKTSLFNQFIDQRYPKTYGATLSVDFKVKSIYVDNNTVADLQVWDTCGEERFKTITRQYYRDINGCFLIFDLTNVSSFEGAEKWLSDIKEHGPENTIVYLIGNKCDLVNERKICFNDAKHFCENHTIEYYEVSALTGENVKNIFEQITKSMIKLNEQIERNRKIKDKDKKSRLFEKNKKLSLQESRITVTEFQKKKSCCKNN